MPVIVHHAPRQDPHRQALFGLGNHLLEGLEVALPGENPHPPHGPIEHMVHISPAGNPQSSRHGAKIPSSEDTKFPSACQCKDSRPLYASVVLFVLSGRPTAVLQLG